MVVFDPIVEFLWIITLPICIIFFLLFSSKPNPERPILAPDFITQFFLIIAFAIVTLSLIIELSSIITFGPIFELDPIITFLPIEVLESIKL